MSSELIQAMYPDDGFILVSSLRLKVLVEGDPQCDHHHHKTGWLAKLKPVSSSAWELVDWDYDRFGKSVVDFSTYHATFRDHFRCTKCGREMIKSVRSFY